MDILFYVLFILFWFLPTFIAKSRNHKRVITCFWINLVGGWFILVWIALIVWSLTSDPER